MGKKQNRKKIVKGLLMPIIMLGHAGLAAAGVSAAIEGNRVTLSNAAGQSVARVILSAEGKPATDKQPELNNLFGFGERRIWTVEPQPGLKGELWFSTFAHEPFALIGGRLTVTGDKPVKVKPFAPCRIEIERESHAASRFFINSGSQGYSGSLPVSDPKVQPSAPDALGCSTVCAFRGAADEDNLVGGFVSMRRAEAFFERELAVNTFTIKPVLQYDLIELCPGQTLELETMMIDAHPASGSHALEEWADVTARVIQPAFNRAQIGLYNTWYAYWTPTSDHGTADLWVRGAKELRDTGLLDYGIISQSIGVWQDKAAFGATEPWPHILPEGWAAADAAVRAQGIVPMHGGFFGYVSSPAKVFRDHPEYLVQSAKGQPLKVGDESWGACKYPYHILDISNPEAAQWFREEAVRPYAKLGAKHWWLDFFGSGGAVRQQGARVHDPAVNFPVEAERKILSIVREELGDNPMIGTYTSSTNRLVGLVDHVRMSADAGTIGSVKGANKSGGKGNVVFEQQAARRWQWVQVVARNMAAAYFYHKKLFMLDPDPTSVGIEELPETLEEARTRVMVCAVTGGFPTVGEAPHRLAPSRLALLKQSLPVLGDAYRCVDLMDRDVPEIHHLSVSRGGEAYELVTLFNWENKPQDFTIELSRLGLSGEYHVFEFWTQTYGGATREALRWTVPARACRVLRLTPAGDRPRLIGSDRHVSVGAMELSGVKWDEKTRTLSGVAARPAEETGVLTVYVPKGWKAEQTEGAQTAKGGQLAEGLKKKEQSRLLSVKLAFKPQGTPWSIRFKE